MRNHHQYIHSLILRSLDGPLTENQQAELQLHLQACPECQQFAENARLQSDTLKKHLVASSPERLFSAQELDQRVVKVQAQIRRKETMHRIHVPLQRLAWIAAAILLVVGLAWSITHLVPSNQPGQGLSSPTAPSRTEPSETPTAPGQEVKGTPTASLPTRSDLVQQYGLSVNIPGGWGPGVDPGQFTGPDGFLKLSEYMGIYKNIDQACEDMARLPNFGDTPQIQMSSIGNHDACTILTSLNRSEQNGSLVIVNTSLYPEPNHLVQIYADPVHFLDIVASIQFNEIQATNVSGEPLAMTTPNPSQPLPSITPTITQAAGLTIEEYPVRDAQIDTPTHLEFSQWIPATVFEKRKDWRGYDQRRVESQARLAELGVQLKSNPTSNESLQTYTLYQGDQVILDGIQNFSPVSINTSKTDFAMTVESNQGQKLVRKEKIEDWDAGLHAFIPPVFLGDALLTVNMAPDNGSVAVLKDGEQIYRFNLTPSPVENPVKGLWAYDDHWVLEVDGFLIEDGTILNTDLSASEMFGFQLLTEKPFYFYEKDGVINATYNGESLPVQYQQVIHYRCCEPAAFNEEGNQYMAWFYALKDGYWYYVEIGKYPEVSRRINP